MPGAVTFQIKGAKELEATLKDMGPKVATRLGAKAVAAAAKPVVLEAKRLVHRRTGDLRKSIIAVKERAKGGEYAATQTVLIGFRPPVSRRAHLEEYGTKNYSAHPFMRPALDSKAGDALRAIQETLATGILRDEWKQSLNYLAEGGEIDFGEE